MCGCRRTLSTESYAHKSKSINENLIIKVMRKQIVKESGGTSGEPNQSHY